MVELLVAARFGRGEPGQAMLQDGWAEPEDGFVWSIGRESTLLVPFVPVDDGPVFIELSLSPFIFPPALASQGLDVAVNGFTVTSQRLAWPATLRLAVPPRALRGATDLTITLSHPDATSPSALAAGDDTRVLGLRVSRLAILQLAARNAPPSPVGPRTVTTYRFGGNEPTQTMLTDGWGRPEIDYVWAIGRHSVLRVPVTPAANLIVLDLAPYVEAPVLPLQRVAIGVDGHLLGYVALAKRTCFGFALPPAADGAPARDITFDNLDAAAPRASSYYDDGSPFAFMLCRVRLFEGPATSAIDDAALPAFAGTLADGSLQAAVLHATGVEASVIVAAFESLGSACELGLLQRRLGREPNGLLRFSGIATPCLIEGILDRFWGLGRTDTWTLHRRQDPGCGYWAEDSAYELGFQTPLSALSVTEDRVKHLLSRALPFLVRKFFEDATAAEKIFVFQRRDPTTRPEAEAVLAALSVWGDVTLLWVVQDNAGAGTARRLSDHLVLGIVDNPGDQQSGSDDTWVSMLAHAWTLTRRPR